MSWQENRQRKRIWYQHYRQLANELKELVEASKSSRTDIAAEAILKMFFDLYERRRLHKRRRAAQSAFTSLELAVRDTGLDKIGLMPAFSSGKRPSAIGEFGARTRTSTAPTNAELAREAEQQRAEDLEELRKETSPF
jgi:hypothetical protein